MKSKSLVFYLLAASFVISITSCGLVQKIGVKSTATALYDASYELETEGNLTNVAQGVPANLKLIEALLFLEPENEKLLVSLIKGYTALAFAVHETNYLNDKLSDNEKKFNHNQAILNYSKAMDYGIRFLKLHDVHYQDLIAKMKEDGGIIKHLDNNLDDEMLFLEAVVFTAQSLGSLALLQKTSPSMIAQAPIVKSMYDWVCTKKPTINFGACEIFYAVNEAGRPKMLGGNPQKGKEIFLKAIKKYPDNWLIRVMYIQFYLIPMLDEEGYKKQAFVLEKLLRQYEKYQKWHFNKSKNEFKAFDNKRLRIYQAIAIERYKIIKKYAKEIF